MTLGKGLFVVDISSTKQLRVAAEQAESKQFAGTLGSL